MTTFKRIGAGLFLIVGSAILLLGIVDLANPKTSQSDKEGALAALMLFAVPSMALSGWLMWSLRQQHRQKLLQFSREREQVFLRLLQETGKISVTQFALGHKFQLKKPSSI